MNLRAAEDDLLILFPRPPKCWDDRRVLSIHHCWLYGRTAPALIQAPPTTNLVPFLSPEGPRSLPRSLDTFQLLAIAVPAQDRCGARPRDQAAEFHLAALHCLLSDLHHRIFRSHCAEKGRAGEGDVREAPR